MNKKNIVSLEFILNKYILKYAPLLILSSNLKRLCDSPTSRILIDTINTLVDCPSIQLATKPYEHTKFSFLPGVPISFTKENKEPIQVMQLGYCDQKLLYGHLRTKILISHRRQQK